MLIYQKTEINGLNQIPGPGALNLMGSMRSAQLVAESLHAHMWKDIRAHKGKLETNLFSLLAVDDGDSSSSSEDEVGSEDEDSISATLARI